MKRIALLVLLTALGAAGCGTEADGGAMDPPGGGVATPVDPQSPVTMTPEPGSSVHDVQGRPQRVRPRPGMADARPVPWESARQTPSGRSLRITYWSGVEPCNVLDRVDVAYAEKHIRVTLYEGRDPEADDVACIELALRKVVRIPLREPVDGREIVDGARQD